MVIDYSIEILLQINNKSFMVAKEKFGMTAPK